MVIPEQGDNFFVPESYCMGVFVYKIYYQTGENFLAQEKVLVKKYFYWEY